MYPDQNPYSIDYLNQIAPKPHKPGLSSKLRVIFIALGGLVILTIILMIFAGLGPKTDASQHLAARLQSTQTIVDGAQTNLKSSQLRSLNSNLSIYLTNANRDIVTPLQNNGIRVTKLNKSIVTQENGAAISARLEDARLNAVYDRTYAREMSYQLETIMLSMQQIYTTTKSQSLKTFLLAAYDNLTPIQKGFSDFNATSS
jgi:hypothetical protein